MPRPTTDQGILNRVQAQVTFHNNLVLFQVTPDLLGREGIRLALEGNATDYFPSMTGAVPSPSPFQIATLTIALLKSQPQSNQVKQAFQDNTLLGQIDIYPDVPLSGGLAGQSGTIFSQKGGLGIYTLKNCVLETVREMSFAGEEPTYVITIKGYYEVNTFMFG